MIMKLNLYDALQQPNKIIKSLKDADIATLTLVLSYITSDLSYIDRIKPYIKGAFDYAVKHGRKKVTAVHKANIMKQGDGLFLRSCEEISKLYPNIEFQEIVILV